MRISLTKTWSALRSWLLLAALLAMAIAVSQAQAQPATVYTVGDTATDSDCDYDSLRQALAAAMTQLGGIAQIRISSDADASMGYTWNGNDSAVTLSNLQTDIEIIGALDSCSATEPTDWLNTKLSYTDNVDEDADHTMLAISNLTTNSRRYVRLRRIDMQGALDESMGGPTEGGGLRLIGNVEVTLDDSRVIGFHATSGGGVYLAGSETDPATFPSLYVSNDSVVDKNTADNGGGIYALLGRVRLNGGRVNANNASLDGGGIYLRDYEDAGDASDDSHFALVLYIGDELGNNNGHAPKNSIVSNRAGTVGTFSATSGRGGGVYSKYGQIRIKGDSDSTRTQSSVYANRAKVGGGIYIEGPDADAGGPFTEMILSGTMFYYNTSRGKGGALYMRNAVAGLIYSPGGECQVGVEALNPGPCMYFSANRANGFDGEGDIARGGAIYLNHTRTDGASRPALQVHRTWFDANEDPGGLAAVAAVDGASEISFYRSIFTNNVAKTTDGAASALIYTHTGKGLNFNYNTVLDSNVSTRMFNIAGGTLDVAGSILWGSVDRGHPFHFVWFDSDGANMVHNNCLLVRDSDSGTAGVPNPEFLWTGHAPQLDQHFAPRGNSAAIDHCDIASIPSVDAYGQSVYDVPGVPQRLGNHDLGAVEQSDILFANSFGNRPDN